MSSPLWEAMREGCGTCFYASLPNSFKNHECRYNPPIIVVVPYEGHSPGVETHRPWVAEDDWCGKYSRKGPHSDPSSD